MIKSLLIIDDEHTTAKLLKLTVIRHGFAENIITLNNGQEGVDYFEQLASGEEDVVPDLVFLDINMPIMNGWDFLDEFSARFEELFPETKICMLTSSVDPQDKLQAYYYSSVITFISKPLFLEEIRQLRHHTCLKHFFG
ncbi:response regulator [Telluribacter sp. SYSU D00476]|uniref:response regulator n=1 Tax=Telluribacter sp. SYSU D00476 TaxID=2811430 RepID=UPI001FF16828|nr:response regulator [Telluribacter sp. SYSU D00476]